MQHKRTKGFTLAELLISLAILGVIATFTIPKVLQAQQNNQKNAMAKEAIATISAAFQASRVNKPITASSTGDDLVPFINYLKENNATSIDRENGNAASFPCVSTTERCFVLANGGTIAYDNDYTFGGTGSINAIPLYFDPDSQNSALTSGPGKSVRLFLYADGRISSKGYIQTGTQLVFQGAPGPINPDPNDDPIWFSWN